MADIKILSGTAPAAPATPAVKPAAPAPAIAIKTAAPAAPVTAAAAAPAVKPVAAATPAAAPKPASSFQNIFTKTEQAVAGPKMIESIVAGKGTAADKLKPILGSAPQLQKTLEQEKEFRQKKSLKTWQIIFAVTLILGIGSSAYFYTELSPSFNLFGQNTTNHLMFINDSLRSLQTKINKYRYMMAQTSLNTFSIIAEQYLDKTEKLSDPNTTQTEKGVLISEVNELELQIPVILDQLKQNLSPDIVYKTVTPEGQPVMTDEEMQAQAETELRAALEEEKATLLASASDGTGQNQDEAVRLVENAGKLVGNKALIGTVKGIATGDLKAKMEQYKIAYDPLIRKELQDKFRTLLSTTSSDIAVIASLKASRINWSTLLKQIAEETKKVDPNFKLETFRNDLIKVTGGINYDSLEFDAVANKISVSGVTYTTDGMNFTTISDLIDTFESSPYFKDVEMRSFSKTGDAMMGYSSNFNFALGLENPEDAENAATATVSLGRDGLKERTGIKRIRNK
jgi:hypothetical protein